MSIDPDDPLEPTCRVCGVVEVLAVLHPDPTTAVPLCRVHLDDVTRP
jgi:hypothetical protein